SYNNREPENIRNNADMGGGALMDIGCYSISLSRYLYQSEPLRVFGHIMPYPGYEVDCFVSGIMEFADGTATFTASTKIEGHQFMGASGENGSLFLPVAFSHVADTTASLLIKCNDVREELVMEPCDDSRNIAVAFAQTIFKQQPVPTLLSDALANMKINRAIFAS